MRKSLGKASVIIQNLLLSSKYRNIEATPALPVLTTMALLPPSVSPPTPPAGDPRHLPPTQPLQMLSPTPASCSRARCWNVPTDGISHDAVYATQVLQFCAHISALQHKRISTPSSHAASLCISQQTAFPRRLLLLPMQPGPCSQGTAS